MYIYSFAFSNQHETNTIFYSFLILFYIPEKPKHKRGPVSEQDGSDKIRS